MAIDESAKVLLQAFVLENDDLERLEALLGQFNIFEAIGAVRQELRHSDFLAHLLDPRQNHGLGDIFAKRLLQKALSSVSDSSLPITAIDLDTWDLDALLVLREWQDIDILLQDEKNQFVVPIENKIGSSERGDQLRDYWDTVEKRFPKWKKLGLYLTSDGEDPSHDQFHAIDYGLIAQLLENLAVSRASTLGAEVLTLIKHYTQMLRRHIVSESEIAELCRRIYIKHRQALDMIFEYRPDQQATIAEFLEGLVREGGVFVPDVSTKARIRFGLREWDDLIPKVGDGWTSTRRVLLFEFQNEMESLRLKLIIGPGGVDVREKLFHIAQAQKAHFKPTMALLGKKWNEIFSRSLLSQKSYADADEDELKKKIQEHWRRFLESDLPEISRAIRAGFTA